MKNIEKIYDIMPEGWKEAAKETKALVRGRNIKTAEELLNLNLLYQTSGGYGLTSVLTQISEDQEGLNKTAVQKRIVNSWKWLKWLCENMCRQEKFIFTPPEWLEKYRVCIVDASNYALAGSERTDFRLHYMLDLFTLNTAEMYFTGAEEGETLTRYKNINKNDLIVADRGYGTVKGIVYVLKHGADFLLRLKANSFNVYDRKHNKISLTEKLKNCTPGKGLDIHVYLKAGKSYVPIRICALYNTKTKEEELIKKTKKRNQHRREPSELQSIWNRYTVVATSLSDEISFKQIFELYRMRWQIELVFKRFKSIFGGRKFTARKADAVKAWFYGKLLLAVICETIEKEIIFSHDEK